MAQGFLDVDNSSQLVTQAFSDAASKANSAFSAATGAIGQLANGLSNFTVPDSVVSVGNVSTNMQAIPSPPQVPRPSVDTVSVADAPSLDRLEIPAVQLPVFTAVAPTVSIPQMPTVAEPEDPGPAPNIDDVSLPSDPGVELPTPPGLPQVELPSLVDVGLPVFEGERPGRPNIDVPGRLFVYEEGEFRSPLQETIEAEIYNGLLSGGDIVSISGITAAVAQAESVAARTLRIELAAIRDGWSARGQDGPSGADNDKEYQAKQRYADSVNEVTAQLVTEQCRLTVQHREFLMQHGISAVGLRLEGFNQAQARALEAAHHTADFGYRVVDIQVSVYNLQLAQYQADAAVFEARIRAAGLALDARRLELERARLAGDLRKQDIDVYLAECQAQQVRVEIYKAQIQGAIAKLQAQSEKIRAFEAKVGAFTAHINAMVARYNAWGTQISAEKTKVDLFQAQASAHATVVGAAKVAVDAQAVQASVVDSGNRGQIELYRAELEKAKVEMQGMIAAVDASVRISSAEVQAYEAAVHGVAASNESARGMASIQVQQESIVANAAIETARIAVEAAKAKASVAEHALAAAASTAAQLAASAMASRHASASVGFSGGNSNSSSFSEAYSHVEQISA
jgi:hypothetical protein